jgi:hypothetical protein
MILARIFCTNTTKPQNIDSMKFKPVLLLFLGFLAACTQPQSATENHYYTQANTNRTAAEWEPAKGTMVVWPLCVPYKLVVELAKDNHLYTLVANDSSKNEAEKWYDKWGIDAARVTFVQAPQGIDAWCYLYTRWHHETRRWQVHFCYP